MASDAGTASWREPPAVQSGPPVETNRPLIALKGVSKRFNGNYALRNVDFALKRGEVHCLCGANGCGKSTLVKIISGAHSREPGGRIFVDGARCGRMSPQGARDHGVQVIYQDLALFPNLSVFENIAFNRNLGPPSLYRPRPLREKAREVLRELNFALPLDERVERLSIAERQQVAICRALAANARLIIMDEPTASLTRREVRELIAAVRHLKARNIAVMFINHRLDEMLAVSDRLTVMRDGGIVGSYPASEMDVDKLAELISGRVIGRAPKAGRRPGEVVFEVRNFSRARQYRDVSFSLRRGEILGICGLLGSGRSELALSLFGLTRPDRGELLLEGRPVKFRSQRDAIGAGVGYLSEDRLWLGLIQPQSIADNLTLTVMDRLKGALGLISPGRKRRRVEEWMGRMGVNTADGSLPVAALSGGNQQKVALGKWIQTNPKVLILDSPTVGIDVGAKDGIFGIIRGLAGEGMAIILISDEVPEVYHNCDRILHFRRGAVAGEYEPGAISRSELEEIVENG